MTLLTMLQDVTDRLGIGRPGSIVGNTDADARLLLAIANDVGMQLAGFNWPMLLRYVTFISTGSESQGAPEDMAADYDRMAGDSLWDFSNSVFVAGPLSAQQWQFLTVRLGLGPYSRFQLRTDPTTYKTSIYLNPAPAAGHTMGFAYYSKNWCRSASAPVADSGQSQWLADTDVGFIPEYLMKLGIRALWKQEKGLAYDQDRKDFEEERDRLLAQQNPVNILDMTPSMGPQLIGPWNVPDGNWNAP